LSRVTSCHMRLVLSIPSPGPLLSGYSNQLSNPTMSSEIENIVLHPARFADTEYLVRRSMTKGYHLFSILTPPIYVGFTLFRKGRSHLTVNRLLRATWLGGATGMCHRTTYCPIYISRIYSGIASGGAFEYVRSTNSSSETLHSRRIRAAIDVSIPSSIDIVMRYLTHYTHILL
jgi:hypothetical protein